MLNSNRQPMIDQVAKRAAKRVLDGSVAARKNESVAGGGNGAEESEKHGSARATSYVTRGDGRTTSEQRDLVAESLVRAAPPNSELVIPPKSTITPLARELAFSKKVTFVTGRFAEPLGSAPQAAGRRGPKLHRIAVASDHGGFELKQSVLGLLAELGERTVDLGPERGDVSVDYPDFAAHVAAEVSDGRADLGIIVDGAGIGSAIVACKFPGVRAANCWDERTARNAREHNHANVLTLGSGHLGLTAARAVIVAFLNTPVGDGRHERRALKTSAIEREQLRAQVDVRVFDDERSRS